MNRSIVGRAIKIVREEGVRSFSKKASTYIAKKSGSLTLPYALFKIKRLNRSCVLPELLNFTFSDFMGLIKPSQVHNEIIRLLKLLDTMKPKVLLEIGTARGGTLFLLSRVASEDATIMSIDLPGGKFGEGYPRWRRFLYKSFAISNQRIHLLRADSHDRKTLDQVTGILNGRAIDFLFIDGDHTYDGVKKDFEMYSPLVRQGGIIAFHDIVHGPWENVGGVPFFWEEARNYYDYQEIVQDRSQGGYGIGLLYIAKTK